MTYTQPVETRFTPDRCRGSENLSVSSALSWRNWMNAVLSVFSVA
jgi:hypothetical protein